MASVFGKLVGGSRRHVSDDQLLALVDGELSLAQGLRVQKHLEQCWNCRTRHDKLQGIIHGFVNYSNEVVAPLLPPPPSGRDRFLAALDAELAAHAPLWWFSPVRKLRGLFGQAMNPVVITVLVLFAATALLAFVWRNVPSQKLTPEHLLAQSVQSEQIAEHQDGVAYQKIEIRSSQHTVERAIYRDLAHRRMPIQQKLSTADVAVKSRLDSAGIDWQNPLSSSGFQAWHKRVHVVSDQVKRSAPGEWTLTTETDDSTVRQASLTVRDVDFHSIRREVVFRDSGTIEIAELNHDVLPWSAVNAAMFEPFPTHTDSVAQTRNPRNSEAPTAAALEGAELQARLVLDQLHADTGEDIEVVRGASAVHVRGVVDTDNRRREIQNELHQIALVKPELQSLQEMARLRTPTPADGPMQVRAADLQPSPLESFLLEREVPTDQGVLLSRTLAEASITVEREARAFSQLGFNYRYSDSASMNEGNRQLLRTLKDQHLSRVLQALASEESALAPYVAVGDLNGVPSGSLTELAAGNHQLCDELVAGTGGNARSAVDILHDLARVTAQIRRTLDAVQPLPRP